MKEPITTLSEAEEVARHLREEFGDYRQCHGLYMPKPDVVVEVMEPLRSCFLVDPKWGTKNLVDGCIPAGTFRVEASAEPGHSAHYIDLVPVLGGPTITACAGYTDRSMIDWRGVAKAKQPAAA